METEPCLGAPFNPTACTGTGPSALFFVSSSDADSSRGGGCGDVSLDSNALDAKLDEHTVHVEVCVSQFNVEKFPVVEGHVIEFLRGLGPRHVPTILTAGENHFTLVAGAESAAGQRSCEFLQRCVASINLLLDDSDGESGYDASRSVDLRIAPLVIHVYQMVSGDEALPVHHQVEVGSETINGGTVWLLPSMEMDGLWESLIFDSDVKLNLLNYAQTALLFADMQVSASIIAWNRVVLLYGPPGTGKTSLCRALANKLAIRMANRYTSTKLIEINTVNLMSKWFSESARLVARMFEAIREYLESTDHLVCLLVDEVESLTAVRNSAMAGVEPSDAIRVVNAVLTQVDQIKRYPNVLVLATSNVTGVIDPAFLDRADIRLFIGPPSAPAIYTIYRSCLNELIRVGLVSAGEDKLLSYRSVAAMRFTENALNSLSLALWNLAERSVGLNGRTLRKLPLLAHAFYLSKVSPQLRCNLSFSNRVHLASSQSSASLQAGPVYSVHPVHLGQACGPTVVSLSMFMQALELAVDSQFAEIEALDLASLKKTRLTVTKSHDSNGSNRKFIRADGDV